MTGLSFFIGASVLRARRGGGPAMLREYDYTRVLGWLRPIIPVPVGVVIDADS